MMKSHLPQSFFVVYITKLYVEKKKNKYLNYYVSLVCPLSQVKLSSLNLDEHARKKMLKLVGERYSKDTDILTITTDR